MRYFLQILGTDTGDMCPSVIVHFDSQRYLFNCGEGTQRFCHEHKVRLNKVKNMFLTRVAWDCVGGLPGMLLTLADGGTSYFKLHGPDNLTHFMAATRHFICRQSLTVETHEFHREGRKFQDENLTISPIYLYPTGFTPATEKLREDITDTPPQSSLKRKSEDDLSPTGYQLKKLLLHHMFGSGGDQRKVGADVLREQEDSIMVLPARTESEVAIGELPKESNGQEGAEAPTQTNPALEGLSANEIRKMKETARFLAQKGELRRLGGNRLPQCTRNPVSVCYVCEGPTVPGKFDPVAAKKLGVKPGPNFGKLTRGESITTADGNIVEPHQCIGPSRPGSIFVILDCPNASYIDSVLDSQSLTDLQDSKSKDRVKYIVHILGDGVLEDERYVAWAKKFAKSTQHVLVSRNYNTFSYNFHASATVMHQLNALDPAVFPLPFASEEPLMKMKDPPANMRPAEPLEIFQIEPNLKFEKIWKVPKLAEKGLGFDQFEAATSELKADGSMDVDEEGGEEVKGVEVVPLGTGAAIPGKYRNVSSTIVLMPEGNLLLDGGEGTLGQLLRHFGPEELKDVLARLKVIFVSHLHADHHLGIVRVLKAWQEVTADPNTAPILYLVGPTRYGLWLEEYSDCEDFGYDRIRFVDSERVRWASDGMRTEVEDLIISDLKKTLDLVDITTVGVLHCPSAYALVTETKAGFKLGFSGDCRPSSDFSEVGKGATLLIHEATLDDDMQQEAVAKRHCTIAEAIDVAGQMRARNLLLTHFSQRYPKIPIINLADGKRSDGEAGGGEVVHQPNVGIAFDLMRVRVASFAKLGKFTPALQALFSFLPEEEDAGEGEGV
ncbi:hypothetical protein HDV00_007546 [Rhizophlyctis rosea]|nr:hypothetical protein HDV00_007546 [Rhizophlyctis rosea]